ncbi:hypothetical protein ACFFON_15475 [Arthrobacter citreus]|uniref:DUF7426 family protein n=1 Tax=Arthrobacter TaxID=1663 RepID=UPI00126596C0|nr:hypothetical protein [Arthrobacter gandavensis]
MSELKELGSFLDPILAVPFRDKVYKVQAVDAETGLRLQKLLATGVKAAQDQKVSPEDIELVSDAEELGFYESLLGDTYAELTAAKIPYQALKMIGSAVFLWTVQDFDKAAEFWRAEGKAPTPNRAARRTGTRTNTGAATTTRKPASRTTTSTPKATAKAARGKTS